VIVQIVARGSTKRPASPIAWYVAIEGVVSGLFQSQSRKPAVTMLATAMTCSRKSRIASMRRFMGSDGLGGAGA
jgi:hypothetical protein